ncbi:MAG TPA: ATP-dependent 6-phosphofructokinase [Vicinamibacterales bacterium]|nr:ATP-dependent 6-phosphofructokinase [Vicinamibacterales bacterium]
MPPPLKRIGVLTGGGDAPGLNAVIRAVVKAAASKGIECVGLEDSFDGLIYPERSRVLTLKDVTGILRIGGTILGTTNRGNPFVYPIETSDGPVDYSDRCIENFRKMGLDALVVIGGDGTLCIAYEFHKRGIPIVGVPKTIDNDIAGTTMTFGFDTAVAFATEALDRLHTTAESHHRIMVAEVMGRYAGWIAVYAGIAGGADVVLIPEIPFSFERVVERIQARDRYGSLFSIVVVAEGAHEQGGARSIVSSGTADRAERLGGIAEHVSRELEKRTGKESRFVVLGHLQRGGAPLAYDRVLATRFGSFAVELLVRGESGTMTALASPDIVAVPLERVVGRTRNVPVGGDVVHTARNVGICFGD